MRIYYNEAAKYKPWTRKYKGSMRKEYGDPKLKLYAIDYTDAIYSCPNRSARRKKDAKRMRNKQRRRSSAMIIQEELHSLSFHARMIQYGNI